MRGSPAVRWIAVGLVLLLAGWLVLLLMVLGQVASGFLLNFAAYAMSVAGLAIGLFGVAEHARRLRP